MRQPVRCIGRRTNVTVQVRVAQGIILAPIVRWILHIILLCSPPYQPPFSASGPKTPNPSIAVRARSVGSVWSSRGRLVGASVRRCASGWCAVAVTAGCLSAAFAISASATVDGEPAADVRRGRENAFPCGLRLRTQATLDVGLPNEE